MPITNGYTSLADIKARLSITDAVDDVSLELAVEAASRAIDGVCEQRFYLDASTSARTYRVPALRAGDSTMIDPFDGSTTPTVAIDDDGDGTFETALVVGTDVQLEPLVRTDPEPRPVTELRFLSRGVGASSGRPQLQITAKWGWPAVPKAVKQAAEIVAIDLFKSKDAPFGVAGSSEFGVLRIRDSVAAQAAMLLRPYRRYMHGLA